MGQSCRAPGGAWYAQAARHVGGWRVFENSSLAPRPQSRDGPGGVVSAAVTDPPPSKGLVGKAEFRGGGRGGRFPPRLWAVTRGGTLRVPVVRCSISVSLEGLLGPASFCGQ